MSVRRTAFGLRFAVLVFCASSAYAQGMMSSASLKVRKVHVRGTTLAYIDEGRGAAVVFLHGFMHDYRAWSAQWPQISQKFRVIAYSMRHRWPNPHHGDGSDANPVEDEADLVALLQALKLRRVHLIGHSGGANLALHFARHHPEMVISLVLGEPGPNSLVAQNPALQPLMTPAMLAETRRAYESGQNEPALAILVRAIVGERPVSLPPVVHQMAMDNIWMLTHLWAGKNPDPEPPLTCKDAGTIPVPALLLEGENTIQPFKIMIQELRKCMAHPQYVVLPGATHGLELENPADFNRIVLEFLAGNSR